MATIFPGEKLMLECITKAIGEVTRGRRQRQYNKTMAGRAHIGTSGWNYPHWAGGVFYPKGLKACEWLSFYGQHFNTVEINNTFYRLPERQGFERWYEATPKHFVFAVKASRFCTHMKRLIDPEEHVALFLESARGLQEKLGVVLFQLPPLLKPQIARLAALAAFLKRQKIVPKLRWALEVRNPSWCGDACFDVLEKHNASLVLMDWYTLTLAEPVTADFVFLRRHGPGAPYSHDYPESRLRQDAERIRGWLAEGKDVYIYFNNDANGYAVKNAQRLRELLGACHLPPTD